MGHKLMLDIKKPPGLLLAPAFINDQDFQNRIISHPHRVDKSKQFWFLVVRRAHERYKYTEHVSPKNISSFCKSIKGILECKAARDNRLIAGDCVLFFENINLPKNLIDDQFIHDLKKKYHVFSSPYYFNDKTYIVFKTDCE